MLENKRRVIKKQLLLLLEELETKPALSYDVTLNGEKQLHNADWDRLVDKLNGVPNGAKRSVSRWKDVLKNWKTTVKGQANSDENADHTQVFDDLGKRLLQLVQTEEIHQQIDGIPEVAVSETDSENCENDVFRRPLLRILGRKRPRLVITGLGEGSLLNQQKRMKSLETIYDSNIDSENNPEQYIMTMQLSRLQHVSQQLENHIKQVQDRIQRIKDMWQHECVDEHV